MYKGATTHNTDNLLFVSKKHTGINHPCIRMHIHLTTMSYGGSPKYFSNDS